MSFAHPTSDICLNNTMMDATHLIPGGWSPHLGFYVFPTEGIVSHLVRVKSRSHVPVRYLFIDFGLSTRFGEGESPLVTGHIGAYARDIPELSSTVPYDAFAADIFTLGTGEVELMT